MRLPLLSKRRDTKAELDELRELRDIFTNGTRVPAWSTMMAGQTYSAVNVTLANAVGLPAVGAAIRLLAETISQLPLNVYRGQGADKRLADQTWQYRLLNYLPGAGDFSPFDLISDIVASIETTGNAFVHKVKAQGNPDLPPQVIALIVIDPARVQVRRETGEKIFEVRDDKGNKQEYSAADILHVRGFTINGADLGLSPISLHRQKLGSIIAQDEWLARHYGQGTHYGGAIQLPEGVQLTPDQAQQLSEQWQRQQAGLANAGKPLVLQNGATYEKTSMSMTDSQFVESAQLGLIEVANIFRIPPSFLGHTGEGRAQPFEQDNIRFYTLSIQPRLRRIELAFRSDPDLFPQISLYPEFDTRPFSEQTRRRRRRSSTWRSRTARGSSMRSAPIVAKVLSPRSLLTRRRRRGWFPS
jgi:HK97 family phage portal protein